MKKKLSILVGTTSHVPYGAEDAEFEYVYDSRLKPFIIALNSFPAIRAVLHYSGVLLNWIEKAHPEFFMLLADLLARRQVELLGGGFYEPMLPLIPPQDRIDQIERLTTYIRKQFGKRPLGCWIPAAAWDQSLVGTLNACGMGYTFLREEQFQEAGLSGGGLYAPCVTEDQGKLLTVMPVLRSLSLAAREDSVSAILQREAAAGEEQKLIVLCPDCFCRDGLEPAAAEKTLNSFFDDLSRCGEIAEFTLPQTVVKAAWPRRKAWFLPSTDQDGGDGKPLPPKQFLLRHPEAGSLYAKMMQTYFLINQLRGDKARKQSAREEFWKGQGLGAFCRLPGGGLFRNTVRNAAYRAVLEAEKTIRKRGAFIPARMKGDFDLDGVDEYLFQVEHINCYVKSLGASVFEFDFMPRCWNYLDTFAARDPSDPAASLRRTAFADILAPPETAPEDLVWTGFGPAREDIRFPGGEIWEAGDADRAKRRAHFLLSPRAEGPFAGISIKKEFLLRRDALILRYTFSNRGGGEERFRFVPRLDLAFPGEGELCQRFFALEPEVPGASGGAEKAVPPFSRTAPGAGPGGLFRLSTTALEIQDLQNEVVLELSSGRHFDAAVLPVRARCPVYGREEELYQSTCILPAQDFILAPGAGSSTEFTLRFSF